MKSGHLVSVTVLFITDVYMRPGWKMLSQKAFRPLDQADFLQTGTNPERDECTK